MQDNANTVYGRGSHVIMDSQVHVHVRCCCFGCARFIHQISCNVNTNVLILAAPKSSAILSGVTTDCTVTAATSTSYDRTIDRVEVKTGRPADQDEGWPRCWCRCVDRNVD